MILNDSTKLIILQHYSCHIIFLQILTLFDIFRFHSDILLIETLSKLSNPIKIQNHTSYPVILMASKQIRREFNSPSLSVYLNPILIEFINLARNIVNTIISVNGIAIHTPVIPYSDDSITAIGTIRTTPRRIEIRKEYFG